MSTENIDLPDGSSITFRTEDIASVKMGAAVIESGAESGWVAHEAGPTFFTVTFKAERAPTWKRAI